jgi:hypothetical protein
VFFYFEQKVIISSKILALEELSKLSQTYFKYFFIISLATLVL